MHFFCMFELGFVRWYAVEIMVCDIYSRLSRILKINKL